MTRGRVAARRRTDEVSGRDDDGKDGLPREDPQHRHHGPHRCRQDDDHRADPLLHRPHAPDRRGPRRRRHHGLDGAGAGARHHDHERRDDVLLARPPHQHPRHPGARGLHDRGRAQPEGARRGRRRVRLGGRRRATERDRLASGRPLRRAADRLRQQDGPRRRGLREGRQDHGRPPRHASGPDPAADRRGGRLPRDHRPHRDEGDRLQGRPRHRVRRHRDPRGDARRGRGRPRGADLGRLRPRRGARRRLPRGPGDRGGPARRGHPHGGAQHRHDPRAVRVVLQEQGRSAPARRDHRPAALTARRAPRRGAGARHGRGGHPRGRPERARSRRSRSR